MMLFIFLTFNLLSTKTEQHQSSQGTAGPWVPHTHLQGWLNREDVCTKQPEYHEEASALSLSLSLLCLGAADLLLSCFKSNSLNVPQHSEIQKPDGNLAVYRLG